MLSCRPMNARSSAHILRGTQDDTDLFDHELICIHINETDHFVRGLSSWLQKMLKYFSASRGLLASTAGPQHVPTWRTPAVNPNRLRSEASNSVQRRERPRVSSQLSSYPRTLFHDRPESRQLNVKQVVKLRETLTRIVRDFLPLPFE